MTVKDHRLALRLSQEQDALIRLAADASGSTLSEFGVAALMGRAHEILADQRLFLLDTAAWQEFEALLDAPVRLRPGLSKLFSRPDSFVDRA
jgi:uncharacterized protein (DUF1778 family)